MIVATEIGMRREVRLSISQRGIADADADAYDVSLESQKARALAGGDVENFIARLAMDATFRRPTCVEAGHVASSAWCALT